jgi:Domain of unknown function (DUF4389)
MNRYPVHVRTQRDPTLSRWLWLVKWLLLIPHFVVLVFLWAAFAVLVLVAYVAVLVTGRYPQAIFAFNEGVLRWTWRVGYYGYQALGTDRYPPFTLAEVPDYPAGLTVERPPRVPRWLPLVAWLFAVPHLLIVGAFTAATNWQVDETGRTTATGPLSVVAAAVLVLGFGLLFTGRALPGLYDLLVGIARWSLRVVAYVTLLTDTYPPFRLDQGDGGPDAGGDGGPAPTAATQPWTAASPPAAAPSPGGAAGRVVALVAGVLLLFAGIGLGVAGAGVVAVNSSRDETGALTSPTVPVASNTAAITAEGIELHPADGWPGDLVGLDTVRIVASGSPGSELFLGVATESDIDGWLAGTAHDELVGMYGTDSARYARSPGVVQDLSITPGAQRFWLASTSGDGTVELEWAVSDGRFAVVLANVDGTRGVNADVRVTTRAPGLAPLGWALIGIGMAITAVAILLIILGAVGRGRRSLPPPPQRTAPDFPPQPDGPPPAGRTEMDTSGRAVVSARSSPPPI